MPRSPLSFFEQAVQAGQTYVRASLRARDAQYRFLALAYLAYQQGQHRRREYARLIEGRLQRSPTRPEQKRRFLLLLHALLGQEDNLQSNTLPQFSRLTSVLEEIDRAFEGTKPGPEGIIDFIRDGGGVEGLYDLARLGTTNDSEQSTSTPTSVVPLKPSEIPLPAIGGIVTKVGRGYRLRLAEREPGEYSVRLRVGRGGFVEAILEDDAEFVAA